MGTQQLKAKVKAGWKIKRDDNFKQRLNVQDHSLTLLNNSVEY